MRFHEKSTKNCQLSRAKVWSRTDSRCLFGIDAFFLLSHDEGVSCPNTDQIPTSDLFAASSLWIKLSRRDVLTLMTLNLTDQKNCQVKPCVIWSESLHPLCEWKLSVFSLSRQSLFSGQILQPSSLNHSWAKLMRSAPNETTKKLSRAILVVRNGNSNAQK